MSRLAVFIKKAKFLYGGMWVGSVMRKIKSEVGWGSGRGREGQGMVEKGWRRGREGEGVGEGREERGGSRRGEGRGRMGPSVC